jgi:hypothetical protein
MRAGEANRRIPWEPSDLLGGVRRVKRLVLKFMEHGLIWAIVVWAAAVALMAINMVDLFWRWSFLALSAGGLVLAAVINWARKKLVLMKEESR